MAKEKHILKIERDIRRYFLYLKDQSFASMDIPESNLSGIPNIAIPVRRDYQKFPLLQGDPSPGDKIAFKVHVLDSTSV